jgi:hypothetical protein
MFAAPLAAVLLLLAVVTPPEVQREIGPFRFDLPRAVILFYFFPAVQLVFSGRRGKRVLADHLFPLWGVWVAIATAINHNEDKALQFGGAYFLESFGAYALGRAYINDIRRFVSFAKVLLLIVGLLLVYNLYESLTGHHALHELAAKVFGGGITKTPNPRWGLARAFGPFPHPILNGVFCGSAVGMSWFLSARDHKVRGMQVFRTLRATASAFFSLSSGAVAMLGVQYLIICWTRMTHTVKGRWRLLIAINAFMYVCIGFASNRPPHRVLLYYLTFSPTTAYNRMIIWEEGLLSVVKHPLFGIGEHEWNHPHWMSNSMDAFWLVVFVQYGIPAGLCLTIGAFNIARPVGRAIQGWTPEDLVRRAWITSFAGLAVAGTTVHFWGQAFVWLCFFLGAGVCLFQPCSKSGAARGL